MGAKLRNATYIIRAYSNYGTAGVGDSTANRMPHGDRERRRSRPFDDAADIRKFPEPVRDIHAIADHECVLAHEGAIIRGDVDGTFGLLVEQYAGAD